MEQKGISVVYASLSQPLSKSSYMLAWEQNLQFQWSLETWQSVIASAYKGIINTSLMEANIKIMTRWYMTPARLAKIFPSVEPLCFRGCQLTGTILHVWWTFPRIRPFWKKIFHLIKRAIGCEIPRSPETALLNAHVLCLSQNDSLYIFGS